MSRTEGPRKTKIGTEVAHVTPDSDTTFKVKGHQATLLTAMLSRQAAASVGMRTCWQWETAATLPSARQRKALRRPRGEERGGGIPWRPPAYSLLAMQLCSKLKTTKLMVTKFGEGLISGPTAPRSMAQNFPTACPYL